MYTILMNSEKELITTRKQTIYQRETGADTLRFLIPKLYNEIDMSELLVQMRYHTPDNDYRCEELDYLGEYKDYLDYRLKINSFLTKFPGEIILSLSFLSSAYNPEDSIVLHTNDICINIESKDSFPITQNQLDELDKKMLQIDEHIKELKDAAEIYKISKADDIERIDDEIYAYSNGKPIGDPITINELKWKEL